MIDMNHSALIKVKSAKGKPIIDLFCSHSGMPDVTGAYLLDAMKGTTFMEDHNTMMVGEDKGTLNVNGFDALQGTANDESLGALVAARMFESWTNAGQPSNLQIAANTWQKKQAVFVYTLQMRSMPSVDVDKFGQLYSDRLFLRVYHNHDLLYDGLFDEATVALLKERYAMKMVA
jgi:hypothetical protein